MGWPCILVGVSGNDSKISAGLGTEVIDMSGGTGHGGMSTRNVRGDLACSTNEERQERCNLRSKLDYESTGELSLLRG